MEIIAKVGKYFFKGPWRLFLPMGALLGFFGSMILYFVWFIAPIAGFLIAEGVRNTPLRFHPITVSVQRVMMIYSVGFFLGGAPLWVVFLRDINQDGHWLIYAEVVVPAILFFAGGVAKDIYLWSKEKKSITVV